MPIWIDRKTLELTDHQAISRGRLPVAAFDAPPPAQSLSFGPLALSAAFGRSATLDGAPPLLHWGERLSMLSQAAVLVRNGQPFQLSEAFKFLRDDGRSTFALRFGSAVTDLYMSKLGFAWRDNAQCIAPASDPRSDFLYAGGPVGSDAVVLTEAHGTFAADVSAALVSRSARSKYVRQVKPFLGFKSPYGPAVHGYSVASGSCPGTPGAFLSIAETAPPSVVPGPHPPAPRRGVRRRLALTTHRSNFSLMGADPVVACIDAALAIRAADDMEQLFYRVQIGDVPVLFPLAPTTARQVPPMRFSMVANAPVPVREARLFAVYGIEEKAGVAFLDDLSASVSERGAGERAGGLDDVLELPEFPFDERLVDDGAGKEADHGAVLFPDGLVAADWRHARGGFGGRLVRWTAGSGVSRL